MRCKQLSLIDCLYAQSIHPETCFILNAIMIRNQYIAPNWKKWVICRLATQKNALVCSMMTAYPVRGSKLKLLLSFTVYNKNIRVLFWFCTTETNKRKCLGLKIHYNKINNKTNTDKYGRPKA